MKKLTDYMAEELSAAFEKAGYDSSYGKVGVSNRPDLCEYQCNGAMAGAKAYKKAPFMIADDVVGMEGMNSTTLERFQSIFHERNGKARIYQPESQRRVSCRLSERDGEG